MTSRTTRFPVVNFELILEPSLQTVTSSFVKREGASMLGVMYLKNVNQSYVSPQEVISQGEPRPDYPRSTYDCNDPEDCMSQGVKYYTTYQNDTCNISGARYSVVTNSTANTCYNWNGMYAVDRCVDPFTVETFYSRNSDCSSPATSSLFRSVCSIGRVTTTHCAAAPSPSNTPSAIGNPSSGHATRFSVLVLFLGLIVILF